MINTDFKIVVLAIITALIATPVLAGDERTQSIFERLTGVWTSDGEAFGAPAASTMNWAPTLGGKFVRLDYHIEMQRGDGEVSVFEGAAYYNRADGYAIQGFWADSFGDLHPIAALAEESALVANWGVDGGKQGRTRYELLDSGEVQVTDWIKTPEGWRQFNQNTFTRAIASDD